MRRSANKPRQFAANKLTKKKKNEKKNWRKNKTKRKKKVKHKLEPKLFCRREPRSPPFGSSYFVVALLLYLQIANYARRSPRAQTVVLPPILRAKRVCVFIYVL